jgi:hypothetical protein
MPSANTNDLYTTVKNTSGAAMVFGFLSKHGRRLGVDATYTVPGDLVGALGAQRSQRQFQALERALLAGDLEIVKSPSVYLRSEGVSPITRELGMADTKELGTTVPSYDGGGDFTEGDLNANDA